MERRAKELDKEIRTLVHKRGALKILKYGTYGGTQHTLEAGSAFFKEIENEGRKLDNEITERKREMEEIENGNKKG